MRHKCSSNSVQVNATETALLSAATDRFTTQPLFINNEEETSSTEDRRRCRPGGTEWASKGTELLTEKKEEWQLVRERWGFHWWTRKSKQLKKKRQWQHEQQKQERVVDEAKLWQVERQTNIQTSNLLVLKLNEYFILADCRAWFPPCFCQHWFQSDDQLSREHQVLLTWQSGKLVPCC